MADSPPRRLKIAVLHRNFTITGGGAEHYAVAMAEALARDHDFHVFAQKIEHRLPGVRYTQIAHWFEKPRFLNQLLYAVCTAWYTRRGFDIVHSHENTWRGNVQTVHVIPLSHQLFAGKSMAKKALKCLSILTSPRLLTYWLLEKFRFWPTADRHVVAVSEPLNALMVNALRCPPDRVVTIAPGVELPDALDASARQTARMQARHVWGIAPQAKVLLWVGNDAQKKGLPTALAALSSLPEDVVLVVAGAANPRGVWQQLVTPALKHRVLDVGVVKNMAQLYTACDVLVHPTLEDTFGMVVLEAMAHSLPVVVSGATYCGIAASLSDGQNALILQNPKDSQELAAKIEHVLSPVVDQTMSQQARTWAQSQSWEAMAKLQNQLYLKIATKAAK